MTLVPAVLPFLNVGPLGLFIVMFVETWIFSNCMYLLAVCSSEQELNHQHLRVRYFVSCNPIMPPGVFLDNISTHDRTLTWVVFAFVLTKL